MRELLLIAIVACTSLTALFRPIYGLYGYLWFAVMRPDYLAWSPDQQFSLILAVTTLVGTIPYFGQVFALFTSSISRWLLILQIPLGLSVLFAVKPELCYDSYWAFLRSLVIALLIPMLIQSVGDLRRLFLLLAVSIGVIGAKFGFWSLMSGGAQFSTGLGGFMSDNNNLALALVMGVPLLWYARYMTSSVLLKRLLLVMLFGTISAVISSHSRGGALALGAVLLTILYRAKSAVGLGRTIGIVLLLAILIVPPLYLVQDTYFDRLATIKAPTEENSALSRILYAEAAFRMWQDYPLLGVGFGTENQMALWADYVDEQFRGKQQVVHNTYLQMLADSGIFAFLIHVGLLFGSIYAMGRSASRMRKSRPELQFYPLGLQAALIGFAIGSTFLSRVSFDFYYIVLLSAAAWQLTERQLPETVEEPEIVEAEAELVGAEA